MAEASPNLHSTAYSSHKAPSTSLSYCLWKCDSIVKLLAQCLITIWAVGGRLLQGISSRVMKVSQASGLGSLPIRLGRECGTFHGWEVVLHVAKLRERGARPWETATSDQQGLLALPPF